MQVISNVKLDLDGFAAWPLRVVACHRMDGGQVFAVFPTLTFLSKTKKERNACTKKMTEK